MYRPASRSLAVLILSLFLAMPLCAAALPGFEPGRAAPTPLVSQLWEWLTGVLRSEVGCSIDPNGLCILISGESVAPAERADEAIPKDGRRR